MDDHIDTSSTHEPNINDHTDTSSAQEPNLSNHTYASNPHEHPNTLFEAQVQDPVDNMPELKDTMKVSLRITKCLLVQK